jgi:hypothetical protein
MKRRGLSRILLLGLVAVTIMLLYKVLRDDWNPGVAVSLSHLSPDELQMTAFKVEGEPTELEIQATGSLQSDTLLAAFPWILKRSDRSVAWKMEPNAGERDSGMLVSVTERIWLEPDEYDVYFASFGNQGFPSSQPGGVVDKFLSMFNDDFQKWRNESSHWKITVTAGSEETQSRVKPTEPAHTVYEGPRVVWTSGPVGGRSISEFMFETHRPVAIKVTSAGSFPDGSEHVAWIENIESGKRVWDMTVSESVHAGGSPNNRLARQKFELQGGLFRAVYQSRKGHGFDHWRTNPPLDPLSWGLTISASDDRDFDSISRFDPFETLPKIVSLTRVGSDALVSHTFRIDEPMRILVHAVGEGFPDSRELFDYAWLVDERRRKEIWKMSANATKHAGGSYKNRRSEVVLSLDPGSYTIYYKSDGSHSYEDWNDDPPMSPQHWGVTVFSLNPNFVPKADMAEPRAPVLPPAPTNGYTHTGPPLVSMTGLGNDANISERFTLDESSRVHIFALGELTLDGRYDYGWITENETGEVVWEMTRKNSERAGGTSKNRKVDTTVMLPSGSYEAHFRTDDSHSFPQFRHGGAPDNPDAWGISIWRVHHAESPDTE